MISGPPRLALFGAEPDNANLGVAALFLSVLAAVTRRYPDVQLTVFDYGRGARSGEAQLDGRHHPFTRLGANLSRRFYRRDSLVNMRVSAAFGGLGNPGVRSLSEADAVLDISGGDSFSDIYGRKRFESMTQTKRLALAMKKPLVLLPQTYGPYNSDRAATTAREIVQNAEMAWARDERSFGVLRDLLGELYDPKRHRCGVDVAFMLPSQPPTDLSPEVWDWLSDSRVPVVGFNVSGMIYNAGATAARQFGLKADYREVVLSLLRRFLSDTDARILLVPHVLATRGRVQSDHDAHVSIARELRAGERLLCVEPAFSAAEMKWIIGRLGFICGTRMHATIAGLSSGVPTATIAYSSKALGVFESCGQGAAVTDPRRRTTAQCVDDIWRAWLQRDTAARSLQACLPEVVARGEAQMSAIFDRIDQVRTEKGFTTECAWTTP